MAGGGIEDVTPEVRIEGGDDVVAEFQKMAASAVDSFAKIAKAAEGMGDVGKHVSDTAESGKKSLGELGIIGAEAFGKILDAAGSGNFVPIIGMFSKVGAAIAEVVQKATEFVESQAQVIETLSNLGTATGMTLPQIEGLKDAFASVGISANGFERSIGRLAITISNDWSSIQQAVRTSADQQTGAMLHVQETTFAVTKAYNAMNEALDNSSRSAAHSALGIQSASIGLRQAMNELSDFGLKSQQNSLSIEGAALNLKKAELNLKKDQGYDVSAQEKSLKLESDRVAVKEAELRLQEANNRKAKEGLELEELQLKVKKARQEADDAAHKQIEESIKASERLKEAELGIAKAKLAAREAAEKQHEVDLKDIPKIASEIDNVVKGTKTWGDVANHAEISAQTLTKSLILAASAGNTSVPPTTKAVFEEMVNLFPKLSDEGTKLALVQHTMGAGFRAGQASAAQLLAILNRGPEALKAFMKEAEEFSHVKIGGFDTFVSEADRAKGAVSNTEEAIKHFQGAMSGLDAAIDSVKNRFAAILSVPLTEFFDTMKHSIYDSDGALHKLAISSGDAVEGIVKLISEAAKSDVVKRLASVLGELLDIIFKLVAALAKSETLQAFGELLGRVGSFALDCFEAVGQLVGAFLRLIGLEGPSKFFEKMIYVIDLLKLSMDGLRLILAGLLIGFGLLAAAADKAKSMLPGQTAKTWEQAKADSPVLQSGQKMATDVNEDIKRDMKALNEAGQKLGAEAETGKKAAEANDAASTKHKAAADSHSGAADRHGAAADKHSKAADDSSGAATKLSDAGTRLGEAADKLLTAAATLAQPGGGRKAADGGLINGPGSSTSDSIPAWLSDGEYVIQAAAVAQYGAGFFDAVNKGVAKFSQGGAVDGRDIFGPLMRLAEGGHVRGAGGPKSDSIPARLSDGEYVMQASAVSQYGVPLFDALNNLAFGGGARFASGGSVGGARVGGLPSGVTGGPTSTLNLTIDGNHFNGLKAPDAVASKLKSYAVTRQSSAAQKMPTWMR